jgi:energy-coupling factor transporter transmembrane protein EcfT
LCAILHWHDFLCPVYLLCPVSCFFLLYLSLVFDYIGMIFFVQCTYFVLFLVPFCFLWRAAVVLLPLFCLLFYPISISNQIQVTDTTERNKKQDKVSTLDKENHANVTKYKWQIQQKGAISYSTQIIENCKISDVAWPKLLLHSATLTLMNAYLSVLVNLTTRSIVCCRCRTMRCVR